MASRNGYGTLAQDYPVADQVDAERAAMLQTSSSKNAFASRCVDHMTVNVTKSWGDIALLGCYIITGLLDSSSVMAWGSFVSMQTGQYSTRTCSFVALAKIVMSDTQIYRKHGLPRTRHRRA